MAYYRQQGVDTAIVRIFNSVLADEQVLYDDGRELRRETAEQAAARLARVAVPAGYSRGDTLTEALDHPLTGFSVPSFDDDGRIVAAETIALIGHPTEQRCYEVRTRYGRSIKVTGDHSLFVEGADGEPEAKPVNDLREGDRIAI